MVERLGLTDDEMREYRNLTGKWRQSVMSGGPKLTAEEEARYRQLDRRTFYRFWPEEIADARVAEMIGSGLFVENPASRGKDGGARPASLLFEPDEAKKYLRSHPGSRVWTIVDGDDGALWLEQGWHLVNRIAYLIERSSRPERKKHKPLPQYYSTEAAAYDGARPR